MERPLLAALVSGKLGEWLKLVCLQWEVEWNDLHCLFNLDSVVALFSTNLKTVKCHAARITATELTCVHFASPSGLVLGLSTVNRRGHELMLLSTGPRNLKTLGIFRLSRALNTLGLFVDL